jgi:DNA-binding CsgD family transcriptional regulator
MDPEADPRSAGLNALDAGDWSTARDLLKAALDCDGDAPELLDGLGRALWWLGDAEGAVAWRERAYARYRRRGDAQGAARLALWISREYSSVWGNAAAANGWLARAERLLAGCEPGPEHGRLALVHAERAIDPADSLVHAEAALEHGLRFADPDLELSALAELGLADISLGRVGDGLTRFDEAMAGATGDEASFETVASVCCKLVVACELAGDEERVGQWMRVVDAFTRKHGELPLLGFCRTCCADAFAAMGDGERAERELKQSLRELPMAGRRSRCVHPAPRLARIRVLQGRLEEAEQLLAGHEDLPEATQAAVALRLARGEPRAACAILERRLDEVGAQSLVAAPLLAQLVEARLAADEVDGAGDAAEALARLGGGATSERIRANADLASGRVALARGGDAHVPLRRAAERFSRLRLPLDAGRARLELARALPTPAREVRIDLARSARAQFEELGANREADAASALLRDLGIRGRAGPRARGELSKREREVLALMAEGLPNAEIAGRLFISPKTAEHHVSRVLAKLGVRTRAEAAAYAVRHPVAT